MTIPWEQLGEPIMDQSNKKIFKSRYGGREYTLKDFTFIDDKIKT
jgi:hypothetical protein